MSTHDNALLRGCCDDVPNFLENKSRGRCPWCGSVLMVSKSVDEGNLFCSKVGCTDYHSWETEDENCIRYAAEAMEEATVNERVNRELARRGQ